MKMKIKRTRTKCDKCGAVEITVASIGARCMYCPKGIMCLDGYLNETE